MLPPSQSLWFLPSLASISSHLCFWCFPELLPGKSSEPALPDGLCPYSWDKSEIERRYLYPWQSKTVNSSDGTNLSFICFASSTCFRSIWSNWKTKGWQATVWMSDPAHCLLYSLGAKNYFYIFKWLKKIKRRIILWGTWKLYDIQILVSPPHKKGFIGTQLLSFFNILSKAAFALFWQSWPAKPETFAVWAFTEKVCQLLF